MKATSTSNPMHNCQCPACLMPVHLRTRVEAFVAKVHCEGVQAGPGFWTAYAQGYLAGLHSDSLPSRVANGCHQVDFDFRRGHSDALSGVDL